MNRNIYFNNYLYNKIRIGIYGYCIKNCRRARITSLLMNYLNNIKIFNLYLYTEKDKEENEYNIPNKIKRITIKNNLFRILRKHKINILVYQLYNIKEIEILNHLKHIKILFYLHESIFDWIYNNYSTFRNSYRAYSKGKYIVSIVKLENDYIFKKWGIKSIFMNNFVTFDYNLIIPSNLSSKTILMIGRGNAKKKRFYLGIQAMEYIIKEIPKSELKIISNLKQIEHLINLIYNLNLEKNIIFNDYSSNPEIFFKNASLNFFPSISESFGLVLSETKLYGIPNIILGIDYVSIALEGTIIIYNDSPESLAKISIKLLKNDCKILSSKAKSSMKKFNNDLVLMKWIDLLLSIYNGDKYYEIIKKKNHIVNKKQLINIINNQIKLLKIRKKNLKIFHFLNLQISKKWNM